jgi:hypothetical protein
MMMLGAYSQDRGHQANLPVELENTVKRGGNYATTKEVQLVS